MQCKGLGEEVECVLDMPGSQIDPVLRSVDQQIGAVPNPYGAPEIGKCLVRRCVVFDKVPNKKFQTEKGIKVQSLCNECGVHL